MTCPSAATSVTRRHHPTCFPETSSEISPITFCQIPAPSLSPPPPTMPAGASSRTRRTSSAPSTWHTTISHHSSACTPTPSKECTSSPRPRLLHRRFLPPHWVPSLRLHARSSAPRRQRRRPRPPTCPRSSDRGGALHPAGAWPSPRAELRRSADLRRQPC